MNWNGGTLPRASKNAKTSLSTVQKRHFAKARTKLQNAPPSSPGFDFSIFEDSKHKEYKSNMADSRVGGLRRDHGSQRTLDEYANTEPLVRHLESIKPHHRHHYKSRTPLSTSEEHHDNRNQLRRARQPSAAHSSPCRSSDSTPQVAASSTHRSNVEAPELSVADSLDAKRQELLRTRDWVGLNLTKPAHMTFTELKDRDLIGRRRPVGKRDHQGQCGAGNKRMKTASGCEKLCTTIHAHHRPASPESISIRIGSTRSGSKRARPEHRLGADQDYDSVTSEEMLLAQEEFGTTHAYEDHEGHDGSQRLQPLQFATQRQTVPHNPPVFLQGSTRSHSRFTLQPSTWGNEERNAVPSIKNLENTPGDRDLTQIDDIPQPSVKTTVDENPEPSLVLDQFSQNGQEYENRTMAADLNPSEASLEAFIPGVTLRATPTSSKRHEDAVSHNSINLEPVIKGDAQHVSPFVGATFWELATKEEKLTLKDSLETTTVNPEVTTNVPEAQSVGNTVAVKHSESTGIQKEQKMGLDHGTESERVPSESLQDEEKLWRDFVFGHDYDDTGVAIAIPEDRLPPRRWDRDGSSMIAEFDFQEVLLPKHDGIIAGSSVIAQASQASSAVYLDSSDLPSVRVEASGCPPQTQQITSDISSDDPLAWTPRRLETPRILFQKPSKYLGDQDITPVTLRIGHNVRRNKLGGGRSLKAGEIEKEKDQERQMTRVVEDDIEDD